MLVTTTPTGNSQHVEGNITLESSYGDFQFPIILCWYVDTIQGEGVIITVQAGKLKCLFFCFRSHTLMHL